MTQRQPRMLRTGWLFSPPRKASICRGASLFGRCCSRRVRRRGRRGRGDTTRGYRKSTPPRPGVPTSTRRRGRRCPPGRRAPKAGTCGAGTCPELARGQCGVIIASAISTSRTSTNLDELVSLSSLGPTRDVHALFALCCLLPFTCESLRIVVARRKAYEGYSYNDNNDVLSRGSSSRAWLSLRRSMLPISHLSAITRIDESVICSTSACAKESPPMAVKGRSHQRLGLHSKDGVTFRELCISAILA